MNYLQKQYARDAKYKIRHNYLPEQFYDTKEILNGIEKVVNKNTFTLGEEVKVFEEKFRKKINSQYALGVGSGTDALTLSLLALELTSGDEVIAPSFTFYATIGAIVATGAKPVFVDVGSDFNIDAALIKKKITKRTKAIVVVHWAGRVCDMQSIKRLARKHGLKIIEDACHAYMAKDNGTFAGNFGDIGCFSLHPLKNINIWGDGGMVVTNNQRYFKKISLLRNHGLKDRDHLEVYGHNSRLDTIQAVVGIHFMKKMNNIVRRRISNAQFLDKKLRKLQELEIPERSKSRKETFQMYSILCKERNKLKKHLNDQGIDAKIHYPIPMHLQKPSKKWGYKKGDFPMSEYVANNTLSLPVHEYVTEADLKYMVKQIYEYYAY